MDGEGRGVMIRMAALIGMRHHDLSTGGSQLHGQAPRQPGEAERRRLVRDAERFSRTQPDEAHRRRQLLPPRGGVGGAIGEAVRRDIPCIARRAIGDMQDLGARQPAQLGAEADSLVIRMRRDDHQAAIGGGAAGGQPGQEVRHRAYSPARAPAITD